MSYSLLVQFWILFNVPNSLIVQLGAKDLLNSWIQTNNVQEGYYGFGFLCFFFFLKLSYEVQIYDGFLGRGKRATDGEEERRGGVLGKGGRKGEGRMNSSQNKIAGDKF